MNRSEAGIAPSYVERLFERHGIKVVLDNRIDAFEGEPGHVRAVVTSQERIAGRDGSGGPELWVVDITRSDRAP